MAVRRYPIPLDGNAYPAVLPFRGRGIIVSNQSNVPVNVTDDSGHVYTTPAGAREAFNSGGIQVPFYQSVGVGSTGTAEVEFHSGIVDTSGNTATQQAPGTIAISGTTTVIFSGTQPVSVSGNVNLAPGTTVNATDVIVETNTGILTGLLPSSTSAFTLAANSEQSSVVTNAVPGFGVSATINGAGRLNLWLVASGQIVFLLRDIPFYNGPNTNTPIEKRFAVPCPAGSVIHTRWDDASAAATFILRN